MSFLPKLLRRLLAATLLPLCAVASAAPAVDANASASAYTLRVVGGLAGVTQYTRYEAPFWNQELARLSGGRYRATVVPFDLAGVPGADMLRLMQLGVVPFGTVLMSSFVGKTPQYATPDLAGMNPDMATLRESVAAFRPYLQQALRDEQGIEMLAIYIYPAQMLFCRQPVQQLADLRGRRVRVSSVGQADFVDALGATAVHTAFAQIVPRFEAGALDCAITGSMSGNNIGLQQWTHYLYALPVNWGMAIFGANKVAWEALPADLRALLLRELPKLEVSIWAESERDTAQGLACNSGKPSCVDGKPGKMVVVPATIADVQRTKQIFTDTILPRWLQRCGKDCSAIWEQTIGPTRGLRVRQP